MKRAVLLALALAACSSSPAPVIDSFSVDDANPEAGAPVRFTFSVSGADRGLVLSPVPGPVSESPVSVVPPTGTTTFTLTASNQNGVTARHLTVAVRDAVPLLLVNTDASPGQAASGSAVTLSWLTSGVDHATLTGGELTQARDVPAVGSTVVHPVVTSTYTLTLFNKPGRTPASITGRIIARVFGPPSASGFNATPNAILQGEASTLSWSGNATRYSISDGTTRFELGPRRSMVVRPAATTTYTLNASAPGGSLANPPSATVTVTSRPGTSLTYTAPAAAALQLLALPCTAPCTELTLQIVASQTVQLRGAALDLPLDTSKVGFDASTFSSSLSGAESKAVLGNGALRDTLVLGIARKGTGTAVASDLTLNSGDELARFKVTLLPAGGAGVVFDGAALAAQPASAYKAVLQRATGRFANAIAVGKLEAQ